MLYVPAVAANLIFVLITRIFIDEAIDVQVALHWAMVRWFIRALLPLNQSARREALHEGQCLMLCQTHI